MKIKVEHTDTFGGEANYSWVRRAIVTLPDSATNLQIVRAAKKAVGINGLRGKTALFGDCLEFRPYGTNTVMFIIFED